MQPAVELYQHPSPLFVESFDDIIVRLTANRQEVVSQVLAFCGTDPGVGTTTVVINLAISLSLSQWKTLLIDGDMRKQSDHKHLSSGGRKGLSDYLQGTAAAEEAVCMTNHPNLHYLPGGNPVEHPLRLMGSKNSQMRLEKLARFYNFILIDSPSIAAANDVSAVAQMADKVYIIAEPNHSTKENLAQFSRLLGDDTEKLGGVIANKVGDQDYRSYRMNYDYFDKEQYLTRKNKQKLEEQSSVAQKLAYMQKRDRDLKSRPNSVIGNGEGNP